MTIARALIQRNRFAEALEILKPLALQDRPDLTDVRFLLGLAASRGSQDPGLEDEQTRHAPEPGDRGLPDPSSSREPDSGACAPGTGLGLLFLKQDDGLAREPFRAGFGRPKPPA